jgi:DNA-binding response OmpR family regulator
MDIGSTSYGVLIVDDDPAICMTMKYALERSDLVIYQSDNGADALVGFNEIRPDLVLLDVSMPGMDGFECCRRLRQLPYASQCAVVMVTGLDNPKDIEKAFEAGATDFITKPINWSLFAHRVHYILKSNAARIS